MKLELPVKLKSLHVHVVVDVPGKEDCKLNLEVDDKDGNGDPNYRVKWDLPGTIFDSGKEGVTGELPVGSIVGPILKTVLAAARTVAPGPAQPFLAALSIVVDD